MKLRSLLAAFAAVILSTAALFGAGEVWVGGPGASDSNAGTAEAPFATIAAGVDACDAGGVVHVRAGSYPVSDQIDITNAVSVIGEGSASTVVYRQDPGTTPAYRVFHINHLDALVSGFTISNGCHATGAGVHIDTAGGTLANSIIRECTTTGAGGIVNFGSQNTTVRMAVVTNCVIEKNLSTGWNASIPGVSMGRSGQLVDCVVRDNVCKTTASYSYCGISMNGGEVLRCVITGNTTGTKTAATGAGGVYVYEWGGTIKDSLIAGNGYPYLIAGAIYAGNTRSNLTISGCTIAGNHGSYSGGILVADNVTKAVNVFDTIIQDNVGDFEWTAVSDDWRGPGFTFSNCVCRSGFGAAPATDCVAGYVDFGPDYSLLYSPYGLTAGWKAYDAATAGANYGLRVDSARKAAGQAFAFTAYGHDPDHADLAYAWAFGDGATASGATATHAYATPGAYTATLTVSSGGSPLATFTKELFATSSADAYVVNAALNPGHVPAFPYATPATAATDIQSAIDAVSDGFTVHVGPGTYTLTDEIRITNAVSVIATEGRDATLLVRSVNKNAKDVIQRCACLSHPAARLQGFALSGGLVYWETDVPSYFAASGAGVLMTGLGGTVADCAITNNGLGKSMYVLGCGVGMYSDSAVLTNCLVAGNTVANVRCRGAGINIQNGLVVGCVISNNFLNGSGYTTEGCAIRATGKCRVTHSRICCNTAKGAQAGVALMHKDALIDNCLIDGNTASGVGGGVYLDSGNGTIANCTIVGNTASTGAGIYAYGNTRWALLNTVVAGNVGSGDASVIQIGGSANGLKQAVASNCLSTVAFPFTGPAPVNCLVDEPDFAADGFTPGNSSPLLDNGWDGAYDGLADDLDYLGNPRVVAFNGGGVDIGCVELQGSPAEAHFTISAASCVTGHEITLTGSGYDPAGGAILFRWIVDGVAQGGWTSSPTLALSFDTVGNHTVALEAQIGGSVVDGGSATVRVAPLTTYAVCPDTHADWTSVYPYATPETAATNVLDALAASAPGGKVLVGPGLYHIEAELVILDDIRVIATEGPTATELRRRRVAPSSSRLIIERLASLDNAGALLEGFTLSNGYITDQDAVQSALYANCGAGVWIGPNGGSLVGCVVTNCVGASSVYGGGAIVIGPALVSNCVFQANSITGWNTAGGGVHQRAGIVTHCVFAANFSRTGNAGSSSSSALNCVAGRVSHCVITNNVGTVPGGYSGGGGAFYVGRDAVVDNCLVAGNTSPNAAAGIYAIGGTIVNCTIADNVSRTAPAGLYASVGKNVTLPALRNCIIQGNVLSGGEASEWSFDLESNATGEPSFSRCLSPVALLGADNILGTACFRNSRYLPLQSSPGVNAGSVTGLEDILSATDLLGRPRIVGRAIDIGAVEAGPQTLVIELR